MGRCFGIGDRRIGKEVDNGYLWGQLMQHRLHLTGIGAVQSEIRELHNHGTSLPGCARWSIARFQWRPSVHPNYFATISAIWAHAPQQTTCMDAMIYSITSSARARKDSGMVRPIGFAALTLTMSSNLVGCWTGKSAVC